MKRIITLFFAAMLAGQAWAVDFTIGKLKYTIIDAEEHTVSVSAASNKPTGTLTIESVVANGNVLYQVTEIGSTGFQGCELTSVILPESLTTIKDNAFSNCTKLASINIPASVTKLGGYIFYNCQSLTSLTIPRSVTSIGGGLCAFCTKLTDITVEDGNANYTSVDGVLYNGDTLLVMYPIGKNQTSFVLPNGVTQIGRSAFRGCTQLQSVTMNDGLTLVGGYAFNKCSNLKQIIIPNTVSSIDDHTFDGCGSLETVAIPASVTTIKEGAFTSCSNLTVYCENETKPAGWSSSWSANSAVYGVVQSGDYIVRKTNNSEHTAEVTKYLGTSTSIEIPETLEINGSTFSVTSIGDNAFNNSTSLTSITVPASVTEISPSAFLGCDAAINIEGDNFSNENNILFNKDKTVLICCLSPLTGSYEIPGSVKSIGTFNAGSGLTALTIPSTVESIAPAAFEDCSGLTSINTDIDYDLSRAMLHFTNNSIKYKVLYKDTVEVAKHSYTGSVVIPASVTAGNEFKVASIGAKAFKDRSNLKSVTIAEGVTSIGKKAFDNCYNMTSISMPSTITSIGSYSFHNCTSLKGKLTIPNSVTIIEDSAFYDCANFTAIEMTNVVSIGDHAFCGCERVKSIVIPSSVTSIGDWAFSKFDNTWNSITIGDGCDVDFYNKGLRFEKDGLEYYVMTKNTVRSIGSVDKEYAGSIVLPATVTIGNTFTVVKIENGAFWDNPNLVSFTIPNTVTYIGYMAFYQCSGLTTINIPSSVTTIESNSPFGGCTSLASVTIESDINFSANNIYILITKDGIKYKVLNKNSVAVVSNSYSGTVTIPASISAGNDFAVTSIANDAFKNCSELTTIIIPNTVTSVGAGAFNGCTSLTSVTINTDIDFSSANICFVIDGVKYKVLTKNTVEVVKNSYAGEVNILASIAVGTTFSVKNIAEKAFENCTDLTSVVIPNSVTTIGASAFKGCTGLASLKIPKSVTSIGTNAFYNSNVLSSLTTDNDAVFKNNNFYIKKDGIKYLVLNKDTVMVVSNSYTGDVVIPETVNAGNNYKVASIADGAFKNCTSLTSITIPSTVKSIGKDAFDGCSGLTKAGFASIESLLGISFNNSYSNPLSFAKNLYVGNKEVKDLVIPEDVTNIDNRFRNGIFTSITILNPTIKITSNMFDGSKKHLETLTYNTNSLGDSFSNFSYLKKVVIGNSVTTIDYSAFYNCTSLESVTIPNSVTSIDKDAFMSCSSLTSIKIPNSVTKISNRAFKNCSSLTSVTIPNSVTTMGNYAFEGCSNLTIYCEAESQPKDWASDWNFSNRPVIWGGNADVYPADNFTFEIIDNESLTAKITGYTGTNPNVIIPQKAKINGKDYTVTTIGKRVFDGNNTLRSVFIPHTISNVESLAFGKNHYEAKIFCEAAGDDNTVPAGWASNWYGTSVPAIAYNAHICNGFVYRITDNSARKAQIIRYMGENDTVSVPEKINGGTYTINSIDGYAFYECNALKAIDIPSSVTEIGNYAFYGSKIESLTLNSNAIGTNFQNSPSLKTVHLGSNVTSLPDRAFSHSGLEEITFSESVKTVGSNAFEDCPKLKKADFASIESLCGIDFDIYESNPMEITHSLYVNGEEIVDAYIPNTVTSIGSHTFSGCSNLTSVSIPKSVTSIGEKAFQNCSNLTVFCEAKSQPEGWNEKWNPDDRPVVWGLYTDKKIWQATITPNSSEYGTVVGGGYVIDSTVTTITATPNAGYHFAGWSDKNTDNQRVIEVTSDTLLTALFEAHKVVVDSAVAATCTEPGLTEGSHCSVCGKIIVMQEEIPAKGHKEVIDEAVAATTSSTGLTEGSHCSVCGKVFVEQTVIPKLDNGGGNQELPVENTKFTFSKTGNNTVEVTGYNGSNSTVVIPQTVTVDGVEYSVIAIANDAFQGNSNLVKVVIPNTIYTIGTNAFNKCGNLETVEIPSSVNTISMDAFTECPKLTAINVDAENDYFVSVDGVLYDADLAMLLQYPAGKTDTKFEIPNSVEFIGYKAFDNCTNLTSVTIPNSVSHIYWAAFLGCNKLETIVIPRSVTTINSSAFAECTELKEVYIPESVEQIDSGTFSDCPNATFYCEAEVSDYAWDTDWCPLDAAVVWEYDMSDVHPSVSEAVASLVSIYAHGKSIIVENAADEIRVYDTMGRMVCRDAINRVRTEITINTPGVYLVKVGNVAKRVMVND